MHDGEDLVLTQRGPDGRQVGDVALDKRPVADRLAMTGYQVVVGDNAIACPAERLGAMAPDVPRTAGDQHRADVSGQWRSR